MNVKKTLQGGMALVATALWAAGGCIATTQDDDLDEVEAIEDVDLEEEQLEAADLSVARDYCPSNMTSYRGQTGYQHLCYCRGSATGSGTVWGTDVYTDDSKLCRAAVHAGVIPASGGIVNAVIAPGQTQYQGSTRNGVASSSYGSWAGSFSFQ